MMDYGLQVTAVIGAVPAIVLSQGVGESSTNQPILFDEMQRQLSKRPFVDIAANELSAQFNGYILSGVTRRID